MKHFYSIFVGLLLITLSGNLSAQYYANEADSLVLVEFYNATTQDGDWSENWLKEPMGDWEGLVMDTVGYELFVKEITTENYGLNGVYPSGQIPSSIGNLSHLTVLKLMGDEDGAADGGPRITDFNGSLPSTIWNLSNLEKIQIKFTNITGGIPEITDAQASALTALSEINFQQTWLGGEIPSWIFELPAIKKLYLHESGFTGEVPSSVANASNLTRLYLFGNELTGDMPYVSSLYNNKGNLKIYGNYFTPSSMAQFSDYFDQSQLDSDDPDKVYTGSYSNAYQFVEDTLTVSLTNGSVTLTDNMVNPSSYAWYKDGSPLDATSNKIDGATSATYTATEAGTYTCSSYGSDCGTDIVYYSVFVVTSSTGIEKTDVSTSSVSPNPFDTYITVNTESEMKTVSIYNCVGKMVYKGNFEGANSATIETADYAKGLYIVKITTNNQIITKKMIKR